MWFPSKELSTSLRFNYRDQWITRWEGNTQMVITWEEVNPEELGLFLWENNQCKFNGFLESDEEFITLLRQIRWDLTP